MLKYAVLDFGKVLVYPTSGDWFITPEFLKRMDKNQIDYKRVKEVMNKHHDIICRQVSTLESEYQMFYDYYKNVLDDIQYDGNKEENIEKIAYNITYEFDKYTSYPHIQEELTYLKQKYKLILLTDNWPCVIRILKHYGIFEYFEKIYISSIYGMEKNNAEFFKIVKNDFQIKDNEALFVDDSEPNLDVASSEGFYPFLMDREYNKKSSKYPIIHDLFTL